MNEYGSSYYQPFAPKLTDSLMANMAIWGISSYAQDQMGFSGQSMPPAGYSNYMDYQSKLEMNRNHQRMMDAAAYSMRTDLSNLFTAGPRAGIDASGKQWTVEQQRAAVAMTGFAAQNSLALFQSGPGGRAALDMLDPTYGGNSIANTMGQIAMMQRYMQDPISGERGMAQGTAASYAQAMHKYMYGGNDFTRMMRTHGFRSGESAQVLDYLGATGQLRTGNDLMGYLEDPSFVRALQAGTMNEYSLKALGAEDLVSLSGKDLADPTTQQELVEIAAKMDGNTLSNVQGGLAAIRELLQADGITADIKKTLDVYAEFSQRFGSQTSSDEVNNILRRGQATLKDMRVGLQGQMARYSIAGQTAQQYGIASAGALNIADDTMISEASAFGRGVFGDRAKDYGTLSQAEYYQLEASNQASFRNSLDARVMAALSFAGETYEYTDDEAGRKMKAFIENIRSGAPLSDEFMNLSPQQKAELAKGLKGTNAAEVLDQAIRGGEFLRREFENAGLGAYTKQQQAADARQRVSDEISRSISLGGIDAGDPSVENRLRKLIGESTSEGIFASTPEELANKDSLKEGNALYLKLGRKLLDDLANDPDGERILSQLGDTEAEREAAAAQLAANAVRIGGTKSNINNLVNRLGDRAGRADLIRRETTEVEAYMRDLMAGTTAATGTDLIRGLATAISQSDVTDPEARRDLLTQTLSKMTGLDGGQLSDEGWSELIDFVMEDVSRLKQGEQSGATEAVRGKYGRQADRLLDLINKQQERLGREATTPEASVIGYDKDGNLRVVDAPRAMHEKAQAEGKFGGIDVKMDDNGNPIISGLPEGFRPLSVQMGEDGQVIPLGNTAAQPGSGDVAALIDAISSSGLQLKGGLTIQLGDDVKIQVADAVAKMDARGTPNTK